MSSELQFAKQFLTTLDSKPSKYQPDHIFFPSNASELRIPYTLPRLPHPPHPNPPSQGVSLLTTASSSNAAASSSSSSTRPVTIRLTSSRNPTMSLTLHSLPLSTPVAELKSAIRTHLSGGSGGPSIDKIKILLNKKPIPSAKKTLADAFGSSKVEEGGLQKQQQKQQQQQKEKEEEGEEQPQQEVTLSVMVMGGAPDPPADAARDIYPAAAAAAAGERMEGVESTTTTANDNATATATTTNATTASASAAQPVQQQQDSKDKDKSSSSNNNNNNNNNNSNHWQEQLEQSAFWDDLQVFLQQRLHDPEGGKKLRAIIEKAWRADVVRIAT